MNPIIEDKRQAVVDLCSKAHAYSDMLDELRELLGTEVGLVMAGAIKNRCIAREIEGSKQMLYAAWCRRLSLGQGRLAGRPETLYVTGRSPQALRHIARDAGYCERADDVDAHRVYKREWELGQDPLPDSRGYRGRRIRELTNLGERPLHVIEEHAAQSRALKIVEIGGFVEFQVGGVMKPE